MEGFNFISTLEYFSAKLFQFWKNSKDKVETTSCVVKFWKVQEILIQSCELTFSHIVWGKWTTIRQALSNLDLPIG